MILQECEGGLLLFRQTDHALLSGLFADSWGNDVVPPLEHRDSTLVAAARHDDGWADWELAPTLREDGGPVDFIRIPLPEHVALYRRGIDLVEDEDAYAGLVASLHGERLYTRPFEPGMDPRIERLDGRNLELAQSYVLHERGRQVRLIQDIAEADDSDAEDVRAAAEEGWRLLQVWDRLSLLVCMQPLRQGTQRTLPPIAAADGDVAIRASATNDGELLCDPYPFAKDSVEFKVEAYKTERRTWETQTEYRHDFRTAEPLVVTFRCRAG